MENNKIENTERVGASTYTTLVFEDMLERYKQDYSKEFFFFNNCLRSCIFLFYPAYLLRISTYGQSLYDKDKKEWVNFIGTFLLNNFLITIILIFPMVTVTWYIKKLNFNFHFVNNKLKKIIEILCIFYIKSAEYLYLLMSFFNIFVLLLIAYDDYGVSYVIEVLIYVFIMLVICLCLYLCIARFVKF